MSGPSELGKPETRVAVLPVGKKSTNRTTKVAGKRIGYQIERFTHSGSSHSSDASGMRAKLPGSKSLKYLAVFGHYY